MVFGGAQECLQSRSRPRSSISARYDDRALLNPDTITGSRGAERGSPLGQRLGRRPRWPGAASYLDLLLGPVSGSFGETSAILIILGGAYIIYKKAANWKLVAGSIGAFLVLQTILWVAGHPNARDPLYALLSGSFLLGAFFMVTDPISSSQSTDGGRWLYGILFGLLTVTIRVFSNWAEGVTFAILLVNMFGPLFDHYFKQAKAKKKAKAKTGGAA